MFYFIAGRQQRRGTTFITITEHSSFVNNLPACFPSKPLLLYTEDKKNLKSVIYSFV